MLSNQSNLWRQVIVSFITCQAHQDHCEKQATRCHVYQSAIMPAPGFYYFCAEHAKQQGDKGGELYVASL